MAVAKAQQFKNFEEYLSADSISLPEGRYEYWDGALIEVMPESLFNDGLANRLLFLLVAEGILIDSIRPHSCELEVRGKPRTRYPDVVVLAEVHLSLLTKRATITQEMPPPPLVIEIVSPGAEGSANYKRDYEAKPVQYADRGVPEIWLIDPVRAWVKVGRLVGGCYEFVMIQGGDRLESSVFPKLSLTAVQLLRGER